MLITLLSPSPEKYAALADGLRAAGHVVRVADCETPTPGSERPDAVLAEGPAAPPLLQKLNGEEAPICAIALLEQDQLSLWNPESPWTDFVVAPFRPAEVAARLALYRARHRADETDLVRSGDLVIDVSNYSVHVNDERIELTFKEYELLKFMASRPGRVFTRDALLEQVWGYDYWGGSRTIDVHIRRIRAKLPAKTASRIETVHQVGYRFATNRD